MPKWRDVSPSNQGGFIFETTEFDVHVNSEEASTIHSSVVSNELNITANNLQKGENEVSSCAVDSEESAFVLNTIVNDSANKKFMITDNNLQRMEDDEIILDNSFNDHTTDSELGSLLENKSVDDISRLQESENEIISNNNVSNETKDVANNDLNENMFQDNANNSIEEITDEIKLSIGTNNEKSAEKAEEISKFPLERIKSIMKCDPEVHSISLRGVFVMARATELFLQWFTKEVYKTTSKQKKHTIDKNDIELTISSNPLLEFLDGAIDWKIPDNEN